MSVPTSSWRVAVVYALSACLEAQYRPPPVLVPVRCGCGCVVGAVGVVGGLVED